MCDEPTLEQDSYTMDVTHNNKIGAITREVDHDTTKHNQQIVIKQSLKKSSIKHSEAQMNLSEIAKGKSPEVQSPKSVDEKSFAETSRTWSLDYFKKVARSGFGRHPWPNARDEKMPDVTYTHYVVWNQKTLIPQRGSTRIQSFISDISFHLGMGEFVSIATHDYGILLLAGYKNDNEEYVLAYPSIVGLRKSDNHFDFKTDHSRVIKINAKLDWFVD